MAFIKCFSYLEIKDAFLLALSSSFALILVTDSWLRDSFKDNPWQFSVINPSGKAAKPIMEKAARPLPGNQY